MCNFFFSKCITCVKHKGLSGTLLGRALAKIASLGIDNYYMSQLMRLLLLSHRRPAKAQVSLHIHTVSPEPSLLEVDEGSDEKSDI